MTIFELYEYIPRDEWIKVFDTKREVFFGHFTDMPEKVANMPIDWIEANYDVESDRHVLVIYTWKALEDYE